MKAKLLIITMAAALCVAGGCSQEAEKNMEEQAEENTQEAVDPTESIAQEAADLAANIGSLDDSHVLSVKNEHPENYPEITFGEAFDSFFGLPTWNYFEADSGERVVEFTGDCTYMEVEVKAKLQFILNDDDTFHAGAFSLNDVPQTELMTAGMLEKVFSQYSESMKEGGNEIGSFDDMPEESAESADTYQYLDAFIQAINSYSDPPEDANEEYYQAEYEKWLRGEGYQFIALSEDGAVYLDDQSANYNGQWWDMYSQRCHMEISSADGTWYSIDINWSSGAADNTHWTFSGYYDSSRGGIVYSNGKCVEEHYAEGIGLQETVTYSDGTGFIYLSGSTLYWEDDKENMGEDCYFEKE